MVNRVNRTIILAPYFRAVVSSVLHGPSFCRVKLRIIAGLIKVTTDRKKNGRIRRTLIFFFAKPSVLQRRRRNWRHHLQSQPEVLAGSFITQPVKQIHFFHCVDYSHCNDWKGIIAAYFVRFWRIAGSIGETCRWHDRQLWLPRKKARKYQCQVQWNAGAKARKGVCA